MRFQHAITRLREADPVAGLPAPLADELTRQGIALAAGGGVLEERWHQAWADLAQCIRPLVGPDPVLLEGGAYWGTWLESTGTILTEVLSRFAPGIATATFRQFADHQRPDGLIPYKVTADGPGFSQIQLVTPLARSVFNHHLLHPQESGWLRSMYDAMARYDDWIATHRDTRGTGGVEAFCTFDTGHDMSPRFWFAPDRCLDGDATRFDPESPNLPYVAPDLTANIACQRTYLARIAAELGEDPQPWLERADASRRALYEHCFDPGAAFFHDLDVHGRHVQVDSDVLLRVLACEQADESLFTEALRRHVMHTGRFLSHHGFTSVAMDDPRFDDDHTRNSWAGPVNMLTQIRAPHAFEHHGHLTELALVARPLLGALLQADRFPQCIDGWSGEVGFTSVYAPSILWFLDAVERWSGILPTPSGATFTGLAPTRLDHGTAAQWVATSRTVGGHHYEMVADDESVEVLRDGQLHLGFPRGWRVEVDHQGTPVAVTGVTPRPVPGTLTHGPHQLSLALRPNQRLTVHGSDVTGSTDVGFVPPQMRKES